MTSTRAVYDASVERYARVIGTEVSAATETAFDRAQLEALVAGIGQHQGSLVADVGCGPGRVASFLQTRGVPAIGIDMSSAMVAVARRAHPSIGFSVGSFDALPLRSGSLAGAVCWYSIIHSSPAQLGTAFAELHRVVTTDGHVLLAFQSGGGEALQRSDAYGTGLELTSYRHNVQNVTRALERHGFEIRSTAQRDAAFAHETTPQAFVVARALRRSR